jgi:hypothetical protein
MAAVKASGRVAAVDAAALGDGQVALQGRQEGAAR